MTRDNVPLCPFCHAPVVWYYRQCRGCGRETLISGMYVLVLEFVAIVIPALLGHALGVPLIPFVLPLIIPTFIVVFIITIRLFPPQHCVWDDYRLVLYGDGRKSDGDDETRES